MIKGTVVKLERFAIHDGPGIRTVIFLKGCPLTCQWCSTPESQVSYLEMGFDIKKCTRCGKCIEVCPQKAIDFPKNSEIITDRFICNNCMKCVEVCPSGARITIGKEMSVKEVMDEVGKDSIFYWNSGGGVTLSGGEPAVQSRFSLEILKSCKQKGFHTAIETCGYISWRKFSGLLKYLDLVYFDIKHSMSKEHEILTGKNNELILENCRKMVKEFPNIEFIIRVPVIPGYNDSVENILHTAKFVHCLKKVARLELLPYHRFGVHMYRLLNRNYSLSHIKSPDSKKMDEHKKIAKSCGIEVQIGG